MKKTDITKGISYLEIPEEGLRILCGCPENSIKFIMQKGLTPPVVINGFNLVGGPNAILLNDLSVSNSHFLNFAEFPVLHHQYFQGAAFNGTNEKYTIIGNEDKVDNQYNYIRRGVQGLTSRDEILEAGVDDDIADKIISIGNYHRGYKKNFDIINKVYISNKTKIKGDLYIERISLNRFVFTYGDQTEIVDINLDENLKGVGLPYNIENKLIPFDEFSITTVGDGNGWNPHVPCMGSLINCKGKRFLVDSGPGSLDLVGHLGITPSEVEGVFVTHSHDDHFAGILSMLNSENKIKFFSTALVIASVQKKFQALLNINKIELKKYIDFIELKEGIWTNIGEMEVKPKYSFHTIETNVFYFRVKNLEGQWKSYGHITDIISKKDLNFMLDHDQSGNINHSWTDDWFNNYLEECDLKRIDAGGGVVHGDSHDFAEDKSKKIILSHLNHDIDTGENISFSPPTNFGHTEVLIHSDFNYLVQKAKDILLELFIKTGEVKVNVSQQDIFLVEPDKIVCQKGDKLENIYMVVSGLVEGYESNGHIRKYVQGDFLYTFNNEKKSKNNYKTSSYCYLLKIKSKNFFKCIKSISLSYNFKVLRKSTYFSYAFSLAKLIDLSRIMTKQKIKKGNVIQFADNDYFFVDDGLIEVYRGEKLITQFHNDSLSVYSKTDKDINFKVKEHSTILLFKERDIKKFPSVLWSVFEETKRIETIVETGLI